MSAWRRGKLAEDERLTLYLPDGAVGAKVIRYLETSLLARVDGEVPRYERLRFTLHLPGRVVSGEVTCQAQEDRTCRLQFAALGPADRAALEPLIEPEE